MNKLSTTYLLVLGFLVAGGVHDVSAQTDTFMLVPNIKGSSTDAKHKDWIDVVALTQTLQTTGGNSAAGAPSRRRAICSLEVVKGLDQSSPLLWAAAVMGQVSAEIVIDVQSDSRLIYQIKLQNAMINAASTSANGEFVEHVAFSTGSVQLIFFEQRPDGSAGGQTTSTFVCA